MDCFFYEHDIEIKSTGNICYPMLPALTIYKLSAEWYIIVSGVK